MNPQDACNFADSIFFQQTGNHLSQIQTQFIQELWSNSKQTYQEIADKHRYSEDYIKQIGKGLWDTFTIALGEKVSKSNFKAVFERRSNHPSPPVEISMDETSHPHGDFVGGETAMSDLDHLRKQHKIIIIQGMGGVGKTTLADEYLRSRDFELLLEIGIAKETENISSVENIVEEWLKGTLKEEPGPDFTVSLSRLKKHLQTRKIGILIDNLEPALDKNGCFIKPHRCYLELLRIFDDPSVQSLTLVTTREKLGESSINVFHYRLKGLEESAWIDYFGYHNIKMNSEILAFLHKSYGGNAKAMRIIAGTIQVDYEGDSNTYWKENQVDPLLIFDLKDLVNSQFNRLHNIDSNAYNLLCRMGCYRFQDVPTVPLDGLLCLLWDMDDEIEKRRVIKSLQNRSLVEFNKGEYWLHPVIRQEAINRLKKGNDGERANTQAGEFWTDSIKTIETVKDALTAFEAYHHYLSIAKYEEAGNVLVKERDNQWQKNVCLGASFYQLGLLQPIKKAILKIKNYLINSYSLSVIYNVLGDIFWIEGNLNQAIEAHNKSKEIAIELKLENLEIVAYFNIGLCLIDLLQIEEAMAYFNKTIIKMNHVSNNYKGLDYKLHSYFCLAFINSSLGFKQEAMDYVNLSLDHSGKINIWGEGYKWLFLGQTYKNLDHLSEAFKMYDEALKFAEQTNYPQVKGKALNGLGELYRLQNNCSLALTYHRDSIQILEEIGAKCDLAEAYFQLALTYQQMGDQSNSQDYFNKALHLWGPEHIDAPKQIERVKTAMNCYIVHNQH